MQCACDTLSSLACLALHFSTTFVCNISHSIKNWVRYDHKCMLVPMYSTHETWIFLTDFWKMFHENLSSGSHAVPCWRMDRQTDRYDGANSCASQFCKHASKRVPWVYAYKRPIVLSYRLWTMSKENTPMMILTTVTNLDITQTSEYKQHYFFSSKPEIFSYMLL